MYATLSEFELARNDIKLQKDEIDFPKALSAGRRYDITSMDASHGLVTINDIYIISKRHMTKLGKLLNLKTQKEIQEYLKTKQFKAVQLNEIKIIWMVDTCFVLAFLKTRYERLVFSELFTEVASYKNALSEIYKRTLHADITALAYVVSPFLNKSNKQFDKASVCLKQIRSLVDLFLHNTADYTDYVRYEENSLIFNSKLLSRRLEPIIVRVRFSTGKSIEGIDVVDGYNLEPLYLSLTIDYLTISCSEAVIDKTARQHLKKFKFREFVPSVGDDIYMTLEKQVTNALKNSVYIKGLIVPILYRNVASIAVRLYNNFYGYFYCVGDYPSDGVFKVRTLMSPEVVDINHRTITCMYHIEEMNVNETIWKG